MSMCNRVCVRARAHTCTQSQFCLKLMNYISISQLLAVTFFGVLASICSTYGNIFFLINEVYFLIRKRKEISKPEKCQSLHF